jgi:tRNA(Ile)-lysidine synthase
MDLVTSFKNFIKTEELFLAKDHLLLAVSGGVDSVVLCELCRQAGYEFAIAHCNFQLRAEESNKDEAFVKGLANKYGVAFFVQKFDTEKYAEENKLSIQVSARELRYEWFKELISFTDNQLSYILTAHHADDNIETILMNFFKGSGINGIKGILPKQNRIIRPLLFALKEQLRLFATENTISYREDSSNSSDKYTRNYFRNQLIPGLQKVFPQVEENLLNNANRFREINVIYQSAIDQSKQKLLTKQGTEIHIPVLKLLKTEALHTVLYEILKEFSFTPHQTEEVKKLLYSESGKYMESATHRILRNRKWLIVAPLISKELAQFLIKEDDTEIIFPEGELVVSTGSKMDKLEKENLVAVLDTSDIHFPLLLRKWKTGDYFYPLGMPKKKKLSRFFIDQKMSLNEKEKIWVLESNKKIIWIIGKRIDDRFKIKDSTIKTIRFELRSTE